MKARLLADAEEREARRLTLEAAEALLAKLAAKMALFDAIAAALRQETASAEVRLLRPLLSPLNMMLSSRPAAVQQVEVVIKHREHLFNA